MERTELIERIASLMTAWGMSRTTARVYAYMLTRTDPVDHDELATDLAISRTAAWNAARELEQFGHLRRHTVAGSKRAFYVQSDDFGAPIRRQTELLKSLDALLTEGARVDGIESGARRMMKARARFFESLGKSLNLDSRAATGEREEIEESQETAD